MEVIERRLDKLASAPVSSKGKLFKETRDRKITWKPTHSTMPSVYEWKSDKDVPKISRYIYRSFDRQYAAIDDRVGDYIRHALLDTESSKQVFFSSLMTKPLGNGQACVASQLAPDMDHFRGSFGAKNVIPLYRDAAGTEPNVTSGLLDALGKAYGAKPTADDLAAYVYALLGGQSYTRRFWKELETPGPRVPLTKDSKVFAEAVKLGQRLIWLHTYAERFRGEGRRDEVPRGTATTIKGVSSDPAHYPTEYAYDPARREVTVGDGRFGPVTPEVWEFEVSGLKVVQSWLGYRMKKRSGKKSSPLDDIRPERWTPTMSDEFLELLWVLEATLAMEPKLEQALDKVIAGPCFTASEMPQPTPEERQAPGTTSASGELLTLMGAEDDHTEEDE